MNIEKDKQYVVLISHTKDVFTNPTLDLFIKKTLEGGSGLILIAPEQYYLPDYAQGITFARELTFIFNWKDFNLKGRIGLLRQYATCILELLSVSKLAIIGIDPAGFVTAARLTKILKTKLGYFSFELIFKDEIAKYTGKPDSRSFHDLKNLEESYFDKLDFLLIQDEFRLNEICEENHFQPSNTFLIPVSSSLDSFSSSNSDNGDFRTELGIPSDKKIVIFSGSMQKWTGLDLILENFEKKWDEKFWLLIHTRVEMEPGNWFYDKITELNSKGLPISLHNKPFENMGDLANYLSNCDFGVVSYRAVNYPVAGRNISEIGLASGKFSMFMMLGIPVIATRCTTYEELHRQHDFGVLVDRAEDVGDKLHLLLEEGDGRTDNCRKLFQDHLYPEQGMDNMVNYIKETEK